MKSISSFHVRCLMLTSPTFRFNQTGDTLTIGHHAIYFLRGGPKSFGSFGDVETNSLLRQKDRQRSSFSMMLN